MQIRTVLVLLVMIAITFSANAQQVKPSFKKKGDATVLSVLIPGGGHLYAGESGKGLGLLGVGVGGVVLGSALVSCSGAFECATANFNPLYVGLAVSVGAWIYGIADSGKAVARANERNGYTAASFQIKPIRPTTGATHLALSLMLTF
jgi:hypothetical protein